MLRAIIKKQQLVKVSNIRLISTSVPRLEGIKEFDERERANEALWARQNNDSELVKIREQLKRHEKNLQDTQKKLQELKSTFDKNDNK